MKMKRNYFYLAAGILSVVFAVSHTWHGFETALSALNNSNMDDSTKTVFTYIWHIIGVENLVFGVVLIIMAFSKNMEKVKFTALVVIIILIARWVVITFSTILNEGINLELLIDTLGTLAVGALLFFGMRVKSKQADSIHQS